MWHPVEGMTKVSGKNRPISGRPILSDERKDIETGGALWLSVASFLTGTSVDGTRSFQATSEDSLNGAQSVDMRLSSASACSATL